jgi:hypothetical protein
MYEFRGSRTLAGGKTIARSFKPYEVVIFRSVPTKGLKSRTETLAMIRKMEAKRSQRNNALFGKGNWIEIDSSNPNRRNNLVQQGKMFDGTLDMLSWDHDGIRSKKDAWFELSFPKFVPTFKKIRLFGHNIESASVRIWKFGEWKNIDVKPVKCGEYGLEWSLPKNQRTVKMRVDFPGTARTKKVEVYEVEMVK